MELVWQSAGAGAPARTRNSQACQTCRARKKRCYHLEKADETEKVEKGQDVERVKRWVERPALEPPSSGVSTRESSAIPGRVSEYNPESVLAELSKVPESVPYLAQSSNPRPRRGIHQSGGAARRQSPLKAQRRLLWYRHKRKAAPPRLSEHYRRYLEDAEALLELPRATTDCLLPIYTSLLDDLIPVMDGASVFRDYSNGKSSIYLVRAMCLVVCKTEQAAPFLRLRDDGPLLDAIEFASRLLSGLDAAIKADLEPDRVTKVQILALMHLHNDGPAGMDRSSSYLSQAICEAWSMSLHWKIPGNADQEQCDFLWWSLRNFDRLNKPVMGAGPFMVDDSDVAIQRTAPRRDSYRSQLMSVALLLGDLMTTATRVYKATSTATEDDCQTFPSLEDVTSGTHFDRFHRSHRAYLELWYHVAAMLSCRFSGPGSAPYYRRLASADRIVDIVSCGGHESLPPLPLVPYAMSMSTTIIYRALRDDQRHIDTAYKDLRLCCDALDALSRRWTSTKGVAKLAKRLSRVLTRSVTLGVQPWEVNENFGRGPRSDTTGTILLADRSASLVDHRNNDAANLDDVTLSLQAPPVQANQSLQEGQETDNNQDFQRDLTDTWPGGDASYFQLDRAFYDLFDYGMPNVFHDPARWEFLHAPPNDDESAMGGEFQFSSYLASPELGFSGHHHDFNVNGGAQQDTG